MADRHVRHHLALIGLAGLLAACATSLGSLAAAEGLAPQAIVRLDETRAVAARVDGREIEVLEFVGNDSGSSWSAGVLASSSVAAPDSLSVNLGVSDRAFVYGTAPASASRVVLIGLDAEGGQVTDGAWVLVVPDSDIVPTDLHWAVLDATGHLLASGDGLTVDDLPARDGTQARVCHATRHRRVQRHAARAGHPLCNPSPFGT